MTSDAAQRTPTASGVRYAAVIFDMDGVVTDTARLHAAAWQALFNETLPALAAGRQVAPFDPDADYRMYVDGRGRADGIRSFLASRGITLPDGTAGDSPGSLTVAGLAARKQDLFLLHVGAHGVEVFPSTMRLLDTLRANGISTALVTASRNATRILGRAADKFDAIVDGNDAAALGLAGKPDPAMFTEAANRLGVAPADAVVIEDAEAGVRAAVAGGFGLVVGVDRGGNRARLFAAGAVVVVADLASLDLSSRSIDATAWCGGADLTAGPWLLTYHGFDPVTEGIRETLCTLGNGYWASRGVAPEATADGIHYPGTYFAGVYDRLTSDVSGAKAEDESMVNAPNWLPLTLRHPGGEPIHPGGDGIESYWQELDLLRGVLTRTLTHRDPAGRITRITSRKLVSRAQPHLAALETTIEAVDWSGPLHVESIVDGQVANTGVAEYQALASQHLEPAAATTVDTETVLLETVTSQSRIGIAIAARTRVHCGDGQLNLPPQPTGDGKTRVGQTFMVDLNVGIPVTIEKVVAAATSRDRAICTPTTAALRHLSQAGDFTALLAAHERAWRQVWDEFAITVTAGEQAGLALNLHTFHVLQTTPPTDVDAGLPARGLAGEGYRGHVFWDEMFIYPMLTLRRPELTRRLLSYRYRRLPAAKAAAKTQGLAGALFPWQSGSDGREETPARLFNLRNQRWLADNSHRQRHVGLAIAYSVVQYQHATGDLTFLAEAGAELLVEISRCFASMARPDTADGRYHITGVMGPDEFHDGYPGHAGEGLRDNAYTNILTAWLLRRTHALLDLLGQHDCGQAAGRLGVTAAELAGWDRIASGLYVPFHNGIISQFDGYHQLAEFDWNGYRSRYANIGRLDLILAAEGDSTNNYRLSKQADVLMLLYLLSAEELRETLGHMGYPLAAPSIPEMVDFYSSRTSHGSTLSHVVHSWVSARADRQHAWSLFTQALQADLADTQGGTTREGVHLGAMAATTDLILRCFAGLETRDDLLWLHPVLPPELTRAAFHITYRGQQIHIELTPRLARLKLRMCAAGPINVCVEGHRTSLRPGEVLEVPLSKTAGHPVYSSGAGRKVSPS